MKTNSKTKFLSENYSALQGLNAVPVGLGLFLVSLWSNAVQYPVKNILLPIILVLGSLVLSLVIDRYYKNTFGEVKPASTGRRSYWILQVVWGLLGIAAVWMDLTLHLPVSLIGLLFASIFLFDKPGVSVPLNRFSAVRLAAAVCIILVSISPLLLGKNWWDILGVRNTIIGVILSVGAVGVLQGVIWHVLFVKSLPVKEPKDE